MEYGYTASTQQDHAILLHHHLRRLDNNLNRDKVPPAIHSIHSIPRPQLGIRIAQIPGSQPFRLLCC